mgnify:CR=1 FL=1
MLASAGTPLSRSHASNVPPRPTVGVCRTSSTVGVSLWMGSERAGDAHVATASSTTTVRTLLALDQRERVT